MNRPELDLRQEMWVCEIIDKWYMKWKRKMTLNGEQHMLGVAKEQLKQIVCGEEVNTFLEEIARREIKKEAQ